MIDKKYRPHYWLEDYFAELMREESMFYLKLGNGGLLGVLQTMESSGRNYRKFLAQYPDVLCEPLERYYLSRSAIGKLDVHMVKDLLFAGSWREANWGAWLVALAPNPVYREYLELRRPSLSRGTRVNDLAMASCGAELPAELEMHFDLLTKIREMLAELPSVRRPMRLNPDEVQERAWRQETEAARRVYRSEGEQALRERLSKGVIGYYGLSYKEWLARGAPPLPERAEVTQICAAASSAGKAPAANPWWKIW